MIFVDFELLSLLCWPYCCDLVLYSAFMEQVEVGTCWSMVDNDMLYKTLYLVARYFALGLSNITRCLFGLVLAFEKDYFVVIISIGFFFFLSNCA